MLSEQAIVAGCKVLHDVGPAWTHEEAIEHLRKWRNVLVFQTQPLLVIQQELHVRHDATHGWLVRRRKLFHQMRQITEAHFVRLLV